MAEELPQLCLQLPNLLEVVRTLGLPPLALSLPFLALSRQLLRQLLGAVDALVSSHAFAKCIRRPLFAYDLAGGGRDALVSSHALAGLFASTK